MPVHTSPSLTSPMGSSSTGPGTSLHTSAAPGAGPTDPLTQ